MSLTLAEAKRRYDELHQEDRDSYERTYGKKRPCCPTCKRDFDRGSDEMAEIEAARTRWYKDVYEPGLRKLRQEIAADPVLAHFLVDHTITFMGKSLDDFDGDDMTVGELRKMSDGGEHITHYWIDDQIKAKFPLASCDSESGQGFCYCPGHLVDEIRAFIEPWVESIESYKRDEIDDTSWHFKWKEAEKHLK